MKTYSGKYTVKNKNKYRGDLKNVVYRSMWEKWVFKWCDENTSIKEWSSEEIIVPYYYEVDKRYHRYFVDVFIRFDNGKTLLVEIKPDKQTRPPESKRKTKKYIKEGLEYVKNMNKWEAANKVAKDNGWTFEIWTEHTLRKMGIMPKENKPMPGKLKPLKPYRKKSKKSV